MSYRTATAVSLVVSFALGLGVFYLVHRSLPPPQGGGYAVLSLDAAYEDRYIGELLARGKWENYISVSTQWVFWDDFGELVQIPLDSYGERVEPFDPRNDGYARRLESFFVHDGKRFFFIPLPPVFGGASGEKAAEDLARCLGDIPFRVEFPGASRPLGVYAFLFAGAAVGMVLLSGAPRIGIRLLPLLAALSCRGPGGFALAALLTALFGLLLRPLREFFISRRYRNQYIKINEKKGGSPFFWGMFFLFLAVYGVFCYLGRFSALLGGMGIGSFFLILGLSLWAESTGGIKMGHVRFVPVPISVHSPGIRVFSRIMAPFALGALASLFLPPLIFGYTPPVPAERQGELISPGEYETHAAFQASFSLRPLRTGGDDPGEGEYLRYRRGEDGLIGDYSAVEDDRGGEIPPFPLEDLMNFLARREYAQPPANTPGELFPVLGALFLCIPSFLPIGQRHSKKKKLLVYNDKRIAA
jgi:hypothetical protein